MIYTVCPAFLKLRYVCKNGFTNPPKGLNIISLFLAFATVFLSPLTYAHLNHSHNALKKNAEKARLMYIKDINEMNTLGYLQSINSHLVFDVAYNAHTRDFPGLNASTYTSYKKNVYLLEHMGMKLKHGAWIRGNTWGPYILNNQQWATQGVTTGRMLLGLTPEEHAAYRSIFENLLGTDGIKAGYYSQQMIDERVSQFITTHRHQHTLTYPIDVSEWTMALLFNIYTGIELNASEIKELLQLQKRSLDLAMRVDLSHHPLSSVDNKQLIWVINKRKKWEQILISSIKKRFPHTQDQLLSSVLLDSLLFMGSLTVSNTIGYGLNILYDGKRLPDGQYGLSLGNYLLTNRSKEACSSNLSHITSRNVSHFVFELIRYYPPVTTMSWYIKSNTTSDPFLQKRMLSSLEASLKDPEIWKALDNNTADPTQFRLDRKMADYHQYLKIAWALQTNNGPAGPAFNHGCPAETLSIMIVKSFFKHWLASNPTQWCMK